MLLKDKTVIVTGATRGIGRAVAKGCARAGAKVVISHLDHPESIRDAAVVVEEIAAFDGRAVAVAADAADMNSGRTLVDAAVRAFGSVDVFVNNAGICPFHAFLDMPQDVYLRTMNTNLNGAYFAVQAAANQMKAQGRGGAIIAVSSISALVGGGMQTHYTPTKAGLHSLMQSCAIALGPYGIRCNSVLPGTIATDINKNDLSDPHKLAQMESRTVLGRLGKPEDLVGPIVFLASEMAAYVTGAALLVDGGLFVNLQ